ncbi:MAG: mechanosensitive ion channel family protein [Holosporales bacterium]|jgi:MscS family membrane protein|nr:mechanosensitive ion channel family protein [Holosporales bacterium]
MAGWKLGETFWEIINTSWGGRLLCAACVVGPLLGGKGLIWISQFLANPLLKYTHKIRKNERELRLLDQDIRRFLQCALLYGAASYTHFPGSLGSIVLLVLRSGLAVTIFMAFSVLLRPLLWAIPGLRQVVTVATFEWIVKICRVFLGIICAITVLEWWGIHIAAFLTGLGFLGAAMVLGAQDLIKNLIAGFLILAEKRLNHGDWVQVEGVAEGYVESIGFRSTLLKRTDGAQVYVPNARLAEGTVVNFAGITYRRVYWRIGLDPEIPFATLKTVRIRFDQAISALPQAPRRPDTTIFVYIEALSATSVDILLSCFLPCVTLEDFIKEKENFARMLTRIIEEADTWCVLPKFPLSSPTAGSNVPEIFLPIPEEKSETKGKRGKALASHS